MRTFIQQALTTDQQERANLNYWAYWVGQIDSIEVDDHFMVRIDPRSWPGGSLLEHLLHRVRPGFGQTELNIHTVWALLLAHPTLLTTYPALRSDTASRMETLSADQDLGAQARRELSEIGYAVRLASR